MTLHLIWQTHLPKWRATYKTSKDMSDELRKTLPDVEELRKLLDSHPEE